MKKILILFAIMTFSCILAGCGKSEANGDKVFILPNGVKLEMVKITAGSFLMGSPDNEPDRYKLEVQHKVTLTESYMIGKYEITQQQYEVLMHNNPSLYKGARNPVEHVSWFDAKQFCDELNSRCAEQIPEGYHFDLPTEAQWEYACRAGSKTAFSCGNALSPQYAWYGGNPFREGDQHREVGLLKPNAWGLFDMHGNIDKGNTLVKTKLTRQVLKKEISV